MAKSGDKLSKGDPSAAQGINWTQILEGAPKAAISILFTAGGLIGFVAFAGSVIVWTRLQAANVAPEQAVAAFPREQLVAIGAAFLLLFGFFGALASLLVYLIDRGGRATPGMSRGLLILVAAEGVAAIVFVAGPLTLRTGIAVECFLLPVAAAIGATYVERWANFTDTLPPRNAEENLLVEPDLYKTDDSRPVVPWLNIIFYVLIAAALGGLAALAGGEPELGIFVGLLVFAAVPAARLLFSWARENPQGAEKPGVTSPTVARPKRISLRHRGTVIVWGLIAFAVALPPALMGLWWLAASLAIAMVLGAGLWRIAALSAAQFFWFGIAVFFSVPLFGTLTAMVRNIQEPQVQPMALVREGDGPGEAIQGIYITESSDRVYFASLETEGCGKEIASHSGRLLWVPKSEVAALAIGPLQDVDEAQKAATEMSYSLTPPGAAVPHSTETVAGGSSNSAGAAAASTKPRLEGGVPAVTPSFGAGLSLHPETAAPGEIVTLRMSDPDREGARHGFGVRRGGRSLRVGGVAAEIIKVQARTAQEAEFVETDRGGTLRLARPTVYRKSPSGYVAARQSDLEGKKHLFAALDDDEVLSVDDQGQAAGDFLRLEATEGAEAARLSYPEAHQGKGPPPTVKLADGSTVTLKPRLLRQSWNEDSIEFRVPATASTGEIHIDCEQISVPPRLQVAEPPRARISVRIDPGTEQVAFDSGRSSDRSGRIVSRRWRVDGLEAGRSDHIGQTLPPSLQGYTVRLIVADNRGHTASAEVHLLRLPERLLEFKKQRPLHPHAYDRAKAGLRNLMGEESAATIQFAARPTVGSSAALSAQSELHQADRLRHDALQSSNSALLSSTPKSSGGLTVRTLAYGSQCPAEVSASKGQLDIMAFSPGAQSLASPRCTPVRSQITHSLLTPR